MIKNGQARVAALKALSARVADRANKDDIPAPLRQLYLQVQHLDAGGRALFNVSRDRSPTMTDGAHLLRVEKAASKYRQETNNALTASYKFLDAGLAESNARVRAKTNLNPHPLASELRGAFKALTPTQQALMLSELVEQGRGPELAALIRAPGLLTGMSDKQCSDYEAAFVARHAPEEVEIQTALRDAHEHVQVASKTGLELANEFVDQKVLAEIAKAENAATIAAREFANATMSTGSGVA